jgi:tRNA (adenine37-N6)-methyltransferase
VLQREGGEYTHQPAGWLPSQRYFGIWYQANERARKKERGTTGMLDPITYTPIGVIHSPFTSTVGVPVQSVAAGGIAGSIELDLHLQEGLEDLTAFSHLILLTHLHQATSYHLRVVPFLDDQPHGIFATRSPRRPNPIGLSIVRLVGIDGCTLSILDVDVIDGTPLLDLKPFVPAIDNRQTDQIGWFAGRLERLATARSDDRFSDGGESK